MIATLFRYLVMLVLTAVLCNHLEIRYAYADFKAYLELLVAVSGMVFTLMGIWIAFLYPNALSRLIDPRRIATADFSDTLSETRRLEAIVGSVLKSGTVVIGILGLSLLKLLFYSSPFVSSNLANIKLVAIAAIATMTLAQAEAVLGVIYANLMFLNDLHSKREDREASNDM